MLMDSREKSTMHLRARSSRLPVLIFFVLVFLICILIYNYWSLSSANDELVRELKLVQSRKLVTEQKRDALESKVINMENKNRLLEDNLNDDKVIRERALIITSDLKKELQLAKEKLDAAVKTEQIYQDELEKLRRGVNASSSELKTLKVKAVQLVKKHAELKTNHSYLVEKISKLTEERDRYKGDLLRVRLELEEAKKAQAVTVPPHVTQKVSKKTTPKVKITSKGESIVKAAEKGIEKLEQDEKVSVESESKTSDMDEEKDDDKNTELSEEKASEEVKPTLSMVKGNVSQEKKISSSSVNVASEGQGASELKPTTRTTSSKDGPEEEEGEKENTAKEDESDDEIANQLRKRDVADTEKEKEKEIKGTGEVNDEDKKDDDDDNDGDEALDDEEKVRESMDSPVGRLQIPDEVRKLQDNMVHIQGRMDPHENSRDIPNDHERARRPDKDFDPEEKELPRHLI